MKNLKLELIQKEFDKKKQINSAYNIGAYAKFLDVDSSSLGRILSGKRKLSDKMFKKLAHRLGYSEISVSAILNEEEKAADPTKYFKKIEAESFKAISDWHHFAIIQLTYLKDFNPDPKWIAEKVGIKAYEAKEALGRLLELGILKKEEGRIIDNDGCFDFQKPNFTAVRKHQMGVIKEAYSSINSVPKSERAHSTLTVAMNKRKMDIVRQKMIEFKIEIDKLLSEKDEDKDDVYHLSLSFFPARRTS